MGCVSSTSRTYSPPAGNTPTRAEPQQQSNPTRPGRAQQWHALYHESTRLAVDVTALDRTLKTPASDQLRLRANELRLAISNRERSRDDFWHELNSIRSEAENLRNPASVTGESSGSPDSRRFDHSGSFSLVWQASHFMTGR
ncbi:hypothetical protein HC231_11635 [Brenneria izadpanahii]|uniref:Uncharacterized protein n=1 Tax=Brenneria izadpanahii TaxID=2722756 RepID=A0ABX7UVW4_9GAMM|nr:hypothetical protein [Brenneria izadpanahii]QTF08482.1 hypothetical protein HC231_11635 [Brenneria izadpanahii]